MRVDLFFVVFIVGVPKDTIHKWVKRGHINRYRDGDPDGEFESTEILHWMDHRKVNKARSAMMAAHSNYQRRRSAA